MDFSRLLYYVTIIYGQKIFIIIIYFYDFLWKHVRWGRGWGFLSAPMPYTTPYILKMSEVHVADPSTDPEEVQAMDTAGDSPDDQKDQTNNDTGGKGYP